MNDFQAFNAVTSNAGLASAAGAPGAFPCVIPTFEGMTRRHPAPAAHAMWAVEAIAPQRKRRTAEPTETSVDRGLI